MKIKLYVPISVLQAFVSKDSTSFSGQINKPVGVDYAEIEVDYEKFTIVFNSPESVGCFLKR